MTNSYDVAHGLSQDEPGPLEPVEIAQQPGAAPATGNTARDQEMYVAGIRTGEENAKHNAAIRAGVPDGWKLVPIEPTIDMLADADETGNVLGPRARRIYAAMLNAAPAAPGASTAGNPQPARDWELTCHECDGSGHVYVKHQVAERKTDIQEFKEECECQGRGFVFAFQDIPGIEEYVKACRPAPAAAGVSTVEQDERSATHGMTLGERIAHVGGRTNAQGYIEFGSPMAVDALIQHVLRDIDCTRQEDDGAYQARYRLPGGQWSSWGHVVCGVKGHEQELRYLPGERRPAPAAGDAQISAYALPDGTRVERAAQPDGAYLWAVRRNGDCLGRDRHWSYEPLPSSRSQEWLALHRFPTAQAAIDAAIAAQQGKGGA